MRFSKTTQKSLRKIWLILIHKIALLRRSVPCWLRPYGENVYNMVNLILVQL